MHAHKHAHAHVHTERVHGFRYTKFVSDSDSSVYPTLLQNVPGWDHAIQKLKCANHACKCYRGSLERLVQDNRSYKGSGSLTAKMRKRLVSSARCAIKMRSKESDRQKVLKLLKEDLQNGHWHCFGCAVQIFAPKQRSSRPPLLHYLLQKGEVVRVQLMLTMMRMMTIWQVKGQQTVKVIQ